MCHVLVIDDDGDVASVVQMWCQRAGFRMSVVPDSSSALSQIVIRRPDIIISDQDAPRPCGNQIAHMLRSQDLHIPMIRIAGIAFASVGPDDIAIDKPLDTEALFAAITRAAPDACTVPWAPPGAELGAGFGEMG